MTFRKWNEQLTEVEVRSAKMILLYGETIGIMSVVKETHFPSVQSTPYSNCEVLQMAKAIVKIRTTLDTNFSSYRTSLRLIAVKTTSVLGEFNEV